jgi:hypothetical protein
MTSSSYRECGTMPRWLAVDAGAEFDAIRRVRFEAPRPIEVL